MQVRPSLCVGLLAIAACSGSDARNNAGADTAVVDSATADLPAAKAADLAQADSTDAPRGPAEVSANSAEAAIEPPDLAVANASDQAIDGAGDQAIDGASDQAIDGASDDGPEAVDARPICPIEEDPGDPVKVPARSGQLPPRRWMLGPWYGTLCGWSYDTTAVACAPGITSAGEQATASLAGFAKYDIPITALHFDGDGWSKWHAQPVPSNECAPAFGQSLVDQLRAANVKTLLHYWGHCIFAGDFDRAYQVLGDSMGGFYLDDGAGAFVASNVQDWLASNLPADGDFVSKRYPYQESWTPWGSSYGPIPDDWNQQHAHSAYVNDLTHDWDGMAEGIRRVFDSSTVLPAPFNEFLGFQSFPGPGEAPPTLEQYYRRLHFGAMQVVMDNSPYDNLDPWRAEWDARLVAAYRYYAWLHYELSPYLHSLDREAYEMGTPIFRSPDRERFSTMLGDDLFVNYVVGDGITNLPVALPPGEWLDYWDPARSYQGPGEYQVSVGAVPPEPDSPLVTGREPIFIRRGAIIPMDVRRDVTGHGTRESEGSLTVLVFPAKSSVFRYFDDATSRWVTLRAALDGDGLTLSRSRRISQPQIYRIEGWPKPPRSVSACGLAVVVNGGGGAMASAPSEAAANSSTQSTWFFDQAASRLIVKVLDGNN